MVGGFGQGSFKPKAKLESGSECPFSTWLSHTKDVHSQVDRFGVSSCFVLGPSEHRLLGELESPFKMLPVTY